MDEILAFQSIIWNDEDYQETIEGEQFRALMDLCFDRADRFSLLRTNWPGARDGPLEQALQPYRLGEYDSYAVLCGYDREVREKCYVYPANEETKAIFLAHITHLFGRDIEPTADGIWPRPEKYKTCDEMAEAAWERISERWDAVEAAAGRPLSEEESAVIEEEELREVRALWLQIFDEGDFQSNMEDPWFFRGDDLFFRTITHESDCMACVLDDAFGEQVKQLGKWLDVSDRRYLRPLGFLSECQGLVWYDGAKQP